MAIGPGSQVGPYEVTALLGVGGMGEVWRARHLALKRDDALKVLPDSVVTNPERLARFQREAEVLASLNHPNIAQVHGVEGIPGSQALVMELVEGPTLAELILSGPLPIDEALAIAVQIALAVEAAHLQGIVHRDLKPSNIKIRPDGTVKVLDFGLARVNETGLDGGPALLTSTLTETADVTGAGVVLGTTAYMSPEQARGERVDARADVWALGCVLYEMLTGRQAFHGETRSDLIVAILVGTPEWSQLPGTVPAAVQMLLRRCLARDLRQRVTHMSTVRLLLEEHDSLSSTGGTRDSSTSPRSRRAVAIVAAAMALVAAAAAGAWLASRTGPPTILRATLPADLFMTGTDRSFALTPDGDRLAYIGEGANRIMVRRMDTLDAVPIYTTAAYIRGMFPSPDGLWLAFIENSLTLRKVSIAGGPAVTILQLDGPSRGAAWGADGTIVFATGARETGLQQVAASGGSPIVLTRPNGDRGEADHVQPVWLPGGRALLFTIQPASGEAGDQRVAILDLATGTWDTVIEGGYAARYVPTGHLVYASAGALWAIRFDVAQRRTRGAPVELLRPLQVGITYAVGQFDVGSDGTFVYPRNARSDGDEHIPVWVDRQGQETPLDAPPGIYRHPRLAADGRRLAIAAGAEIITWDTGRPWSTAARLSFNRVIDWFPVWTPDGRVVFGSWRGGGFSNIYVQAPDRAEPERLTDNADMQLPTSITPDGSTLVFHSFMQRLEGLRLDGKGDGRPFVLVETPREERNGVVSPDGRWLAYEGESSAVAGQLDIFVRPFPDVQRSLWQVTSSGGLYPAWGAGGRELFYLKPDGTLVAVPVEGTDGTWRVGTATDLFRGPYLYQGDGSLGRQYDVAADGRRFIMLKNARDLGTTPHFVIVQHWLAELERLVPQ